MPRAGFGPRAGSADRRSAQGVRVRLSTAIFPSRRKSASKRRRPCSKRSSKRFEPMPARSRSSRSCRFSAMWGQIEYLRELEFHFCSPQQYPPCLRRRRDAARRSVIWATVRWGARPLSGGDHAPSRAQFDHVGSDQSPPADYCHGALCAVRGERLPGQPVRRGGHRGRGRLRRAGFGGL